MIKKCCSIIWVVLLFVVSGVAQQCIVLTSDKAVYLPYEPVYLTFELIPDLAPPDLYFGDLETETTNMALEITGPDDIRYIYRPRVHVTPMNAVKIDNTVVYSTIILTGRQIVTEKPGNYSLRLIDQNGMALSSRKLHFKVNEPDNESDKEALTIILKHPIAYAMFIYLEGGDQIIEGVAAVKALAEGNSTYAPVARAIMAIDYSQISYDTKNEKIRRDIDVNKAVYFFPDPYDDKIPSYLKLKAVLTAIEQIPATKMTEKLKSRMISISQRFRTDKASNTKIFKNIDSLLK